jgi:hypothetical protein
LKDVSEVAFETGRVRICEIVRNRIHNLHARLSAEYVSINDVSAIGILHNRCIRFSNGNAAELK